MCGDNGITQRNRDGEIAYLDACIGRLIAALERTGRFDRTLIAVVADHGESLGEHGEQEHGMFLYEEVLRIPWIMRLPARAHAGVTIAEQVRAIDAKNASFPAWSEEGARIAWLEKKDRRKYDLVIAGIAAK